MKGTVRFGRGLSSSRHGSSLKLDAEDLEVAGLGGYALGSAGDDESGDRQVGATHQPHLHSRSRLPCFFVAGTERICHSCSAAVLRL
jgi:hypothetical protein